MELGAKVRSVGAVPAGRVWAENSGAASLPSLMPGLCCVGGKVVQHSFGLVMTDGRFLFGGRYLHRGLLVARNGERGS